ncbi:MAG: hypothetical protein KDK39_15120 [Leptospiraceae bacterium]|nr:hypothetical protein [Leptospiraceae bacterium]
MKDFENKGFAIRVRPTEAGLHLSWEGEIHVPNPSDLLRPWLEQLLDLLQQEQWQLECDFRPCVYMNSASIAPLIQLLRELASREIQSVFIYDAERKVQAASFRALDVIARKSPFTEIQGVPSA